ncbi:MAG: hypothetical protein EKK55_25120 [Rhodocyclaceae bacterium]|nr:MAG: hypothetical protein EKK55_25120 [Rhodocyclaceae bacterium]
MKVRRPSVKIRSPGLLEERVDRLLAVVEAFAAANRPVPGHVLRELVSLRPNWGRRRMPAIVVEASQVLRRSGR